MIDVVIEKASVDYKAIDDNFPFSPESNDENITSNLQDETSDVNFTQIRDELGDILDQINYREYSVNEA